MPERKFTYHWSHTGPGRAEDYTAHDGMTRIGRVYRVTATTTNTGGWHWTMNASGRQPHRLRQWHGRQPRRGLPPGGGELSGFLQGSEPRSG